MSLVINNYEQSRPVVIPGREAESSCDEGGGEDP